jgi:N6-L-threonylcarbamoyladenine synthase
MLVLGIETSCDETAAAIVEDGLRVRSSIVASQIEIHAPYGGVVPELASRAHTERILPVLRGALAQASVGLPDVDAIAVGHRPGLIGALLIGVAAAKALAWSLGKPVIGVDHVHAHLYAGVLSPPSPATDVRNDAQAAHIAGLFPAIGLVVSGGHTSLYLLKSWLDLARLGATIDDALGEAFDKAATILKIPFPGGPNLDRLAGEPDANDHAAELPVSRLSPTSLDFSFSGLKTALLYEVRGVPEHPSHRRPESRHTPPPLLTQERRRDLAASFQRAACRAVVLKLDRALAQLAESGIRPRTLLTGGGVVANSRLRAELGDFASKNGLSIRLPPPAYCVDNAAMIAGLAFHELNGGRVSDLTLEPVPTTSC